MSKRTRSHKRMGAVALARRGVFQVGVEGVTEVALIGDGRVPSKVRVQPDPEVPEIPGWHHYVTSSGRVYYYREPAPAESLSA